jgi:HEAT repeats
MMTINGAAEQRGRAVFCAAVLVLLATAVRVEAQSLAQRAQIRDGKVRLSYAARPEVCGSGRDVHIVRATDDWESECQHGPARLVLEWHGSMLTRVDTYVGGRWRAAGADVTDLGMVSAPEAAAFLLDLAPRVPGGAADDLIFPATLADSVEVWPKLIALARNKEIPRQVRKNAIFWLGQAAGDRALKDLGSLVTEQDQDVDVQEQAVFALSRLRDGAGVPSLLDIARTHANPKIRKTAMFWLSQSSDPRAVALFEEILEKR